ncbi:MAG: ABC transporter substrate-binding protein [Lachnospiraceae bacterium]|nr:ABC transporter substrate-binding protein [Lachnospiraceae bacterium]
MKKIEIEKMGLKIGALCAALLLLGAVPGCGAGNESEKMETAVVTVVPAVTEQAEAETQTARNAEDGTQTAASSITYTDALGRSIVLEAEELERIRSGEEKTAVLNGSFAEIWSIAGGRLDVVTEDAYEDGRQVQLTEETVNAGAMKSPSLETLLEADVKLAVLNAETKEHVSMQEALEGAGIRTIYHSVETFEDYLKVLRLFTQITGREDCYEQYGVQLREEIAEQLARQDDSHPTVLFIRAYSSGARAKGSDSMTGIMLKELGCENIADSEENLLDDLSMEVILEKDPEYIFVTTMGKDDQAALDSVKALLQDNPAWSSLTAVAEGHYYVLPKNMFHNKPNQRWAESYRMLADYLYPEKGTDENETK